MHTNNRAITNSSASISRHAMRGFSRAGGIGTPAAVALAGEVGSSSRLSPQVVEFPKRQADSDMQQLEASIAELDHILLCMSSAWDGDGFYEIEDRRPGFPPNVHHVARHFCEALGGLNLWGAYYWDGYLIAPRDIIEPSRIVRKVGDPELKAPRVRR